MEQTNLLPTVAEATPPMQTEHVPPELLDDPASPLEKARRADAARETFPGEHWVVLGLGVAVWMFTRRNPHWLVRTGGGFLATFLVARAATGHEGLAKALSYTPLGSKINVCPPCEPGAPTRSGPRGGL